jgi:hypothetical protein
MMEAAVFFKNISSNTQMAGSTSPVTTIVCQIVSSKWEAYCTVLLFPLNLRLWSSGFYSAQCNVLVWMFQRNVFSTSSSLSYLSLNLYTSNVCTACLLTANLSLTFGNTRKWSVSQSDHLKDHTWGILKCLHLSISMWLI